MARHAMNEAKQPHMTAAMVTGESTPEAGISDDDIPLGSQLSNADSHMAMSIAESTATGILSEGGTPMELEQPDPYQNESDGSLLEGDECHAGSGREPAAMRRVRSGREPAARRESEPLVEADGSRACGRREPMATQTAEVEPVRWLLHGKPGTGKSHAIKKCKPSLKKLLVTGRTWISRL